MTTIETIAEGKSPRARANLLAFKDELEQIGKRELYLAQLRAGDISAGEVLDGSSQEEYGWDCATLCFPGPGYNLFYAYRGTEEQVKEVIKLLKKQGKCKGHAAIFHIPSTLDTIPYGIIIEKSAQRKNKPRSLMNLLPFLIAEEAKYQNYRRRQKELEAFAELGKSA